VIAGGAWDSRRVAFRSGEEGRRDEPGSARSRLWPGLALSAQNKSGRGVRSFARGRPSSTPADPGPRRLSLMPSHIADRGAIDTEPARWSGPSRDSGQIGSIRTRTSCRAGKTLLIFQTHADRRGSDWRSVKLSGGNEDSYIGSGALRLSSRGSIAPGRMPQDGRQNTMLHPRRQACRTPFFSSFSKPIFGHHRDGRGRFPDEDDPSCSCVEAPGQPAGSPRVDLRRDAPAPAGRRPGSRVRRAPSCGGEGSVRS
jgi:hypothetical protein